MTKDIVAIIVSYNSKIRRFKKALEAQAISSMCKMLYNKRIIKGKATEPAYLVFVNNFKDAL